MVRVLDTCLVGSHCPCRPRPPSPVIPRGLKIVLVRGLKIVLDILSNQESDQISGVVTSAVLVVQL